ncbi:MAG: hypothetical protein V4594_08675 [Bacteroidota bacterium]
MITKELTLQLSVYRKNGKTSMVFKKPGILYRVNNLLEPLRFIGEMVQLAKAIATGAAQNCRYVLRAARGMEWILEVVHTNGLMELRLLQLIDELPDTRLVFAWTGRDVGFIEAATVLGYWS